ncbi:ABC transporter permease [Dyadobacter endophyticus]|uniref:ABC transporter permease n=1 Tax=Dyadobacter endophyticus TaxID=1749036 RepID=UPI003CF14719
MKYALLIQISRALLLARWKQTLVAAIGVTFSITMFIALLSFMSGLNQLLDGLIINRTPHVRLYNDIKTSPVQPVALSANFKGASHHFVRSVKPKAERPEIRNSRAIIKALQKDPMVLGVAPKLVTQVFYNLGAVRINGIINGIQPQQEKRLFLFQDYVTRGDASDLDRVSGGVILGKDIADKMMAAPGEVIYVTTITGAMMPLKVVGYFQSGLREIDQVNSYVSMATAQKLLGKPSNYMTDIQVKLRDIGNAPLLAGQFSKRFSVDAIDVQTENAQYETGSFIRSLISYSVGITLLVVAGFGIYNILNMMIYEKMDSIAILKATGFSGWDVKFIFTGIAAGIGILGGLIGLLLGFGASLLIDQVPFETSSLPTIKTYPVNYDPVFYLIGFGFSAATTFFAGYFPARKASRIDPVIIIRGK